MSKRKLRSIDEKWAEDSSVKAKRQDINNLMRALSAALTCSDTIELMPDGRHRIVEDGQQGKQEMLLAMRKRMEEEAGLPNGAVDKLNYAQWLDGHQDQIQGRNYVVGIVRIPLRVVEQLIGVHNAGDDARYQQICDDMMDKVSSDTYLFAKMRETLDNLLPAGE